MDWFMIYWFITDARGWWLVDGDVCHNFDDSDSNSSMIDLGLIGLLMIMDYKDRLLMIMLDENLLWFIETLDQW